jgi:hypothetical protein
MPATWSDFVSSRYSRVAVFKSYLDGPSSVDAEVAWRYSYSHDDRALGGTESQALSRLTKVNCRESEREMRSGLPCHM